MINDVEMLNYILQNAEMGCHCIVKFYCQSNDYLAVNGACESGGVALVRINVHRGSVLGADPDYYVAENGLSACAYADPCGYYLLIDKTELLGGFGIEVDVSFCRDNALSDLYLAGGSDKLAAGRSLNSAGFLNGSSDTELARVGERYLDLIVGSFGTEDRHDHLASGTNYRYLLKAGELTGLRKILFVCELIALSEKGVKSFSANVNVMRGSLYHNFHV